MPCEQAQRRSCRLTFYRRSLILSYPAHDAPPDHAFAISIPYPAISLHAIQRYGVRRPSASTPPDANGQEPSRFVDMQTIYLQIDPRFATRHNENPTDDDDTDDEDINLLLIPGAAHHSDDASRDLLAAGVKEVFEAMSRCADLHPDPVDEEMMDDDNGALTGGGGMSTLR